MLASCQTITVLSLRCRRGAIGTGDGQAGCRTGRKRYRRMQAHAAPTTAGWTEPADERVSQAHRELDSRVSLAGSRGAAMAVTCRSQARLQLDQQAAAAAADGGMSTDGCKTSSWFYCLSLLLALVRMVWQGLQLQPPSMLATPSALRCPIVLPISHAPSRGGPPGCREESESAEAGKMCAES